MSTSEFYITITRRTVGNQPEEAFSFLIHDPAWSYIRKHGDQGINEIQQQLISISRFLENYRGMRCEDDDHAPPVVSSNPKPRPCPHYYVIGRHIEEASDLVADMGYHVGTAMVYCLRAGKKPGNSAEEDLRKAADHLLMEADRMAVR